jgi:hypothetical protein
MCELKLAIHYTFLNAKMKGEMLSNVKQQVGGDECGVSVEWC